MQVDGVFSGGGVKAFSYLGALEVCEKRGIEFKRIAGTSAGALIASLIKVGYKTDELKQILENIKTNELLDQNPFIRRIPLLRWLFLYKTLGLYKGAVIENWIDQLLQNKGVRTFGDLNGNELFIIGTDITSGRLVVFPDDLKEFYGIEPKTFPIARAVRASIGIPYFFKPIQIKSNHKTHIFIDGAALSNFPYWIFKQDGDKKTRPTLGIKLSSNQLTIPKQSIHNGIDMLQAIFSTVLQAHDSRYVSEEDAKDIIFLPAENISSTNFDLTDEERAYLINLGKMRAEAFFKTWLG